MNNRYPPKIAIVGSINMDLLIRASKLPLPGETMIAQSKTENPGGKGANQAVAAARIGAAVTIIGCVGDDRFSDSLLKNLEVEQVDTSHVVQRENTASGIAIVMVEESGENAILVVPGANGLVNMKDIEHAKEIICNSDLLLVQLEVPQETVMAAIQVAQAADVPVILDPAPAPLECHPDLLNVKLICPNQSEASSLLGKSVDSMEAAHSLIEELSELGPQQVVITMGEQGAVVFDGETVQTVSAYPVDVVDSTAAGDAFAAGLAVRLAEQASLVEAVQFASAAGGLAAAGFGAQSAMPTREQIEALLKQQ